jgi:DNA-binding NarL/FixJ family response regulator
MRWLLVVDNDPSKRLKWREAAERAAGFRIVEAESYATALEALEADDIDLMVTDLFLTLESEQTENIGEADGLRLIEHDVEPLIRECQRRGLKPYEYIVDVIEPKPAEPEAVDFPSSRNVTLSTA